MCLTEPLGLLVALSIMRAESHCRLIRLTVLPEKVISMLVRLWPQADCWITPEGMHLVLVLQLRLSATLVMLQRGNCWPHPRACQFCCFISKCQAN